MTVNQKPHDFTGVKNIYDILMPLRSEKGEVGMKFKRWANEIRTDVRKTLVVPLFNSFQKMFLSNFVRR